MKRNKLIMGLALFLLAPPMQESTGFLGFDWWIWILAGVLLLLLLLIIGYVLQNEPGPPIPERESRMYITPSTAARTQVEELEKPEAPAQPEPAPQPAEESEVEEPAAEPVPGKPAPKPENLTRIEGIGPKVAGLLNEAGITTFTALAETDVTRLKEILEKAELQFMDPGSWPEQAALASKGDWEAFEKLTDELKGGRQTS
ncbi:MAG: DUF4332 domain-containing protein [Candidatus Promineifilaceae bacterium]